MVACQARAGTSASSSVVGLSGAAIPVVAQVRGCRGAQQVRLVGDDGNVGVLEGLCEGGKRLGFGWADRIDINRLRKATQKCSTLKNNSAALTHQQNPRPVAAHKQRARNGVALALALRIVALCPQLLRLYGGENVVDGKAVMILS